jgi:D-alanyl-D-alanine carboxypeptidase
MKKFKFLPLILLICILLSAAVPTTAMALEDPQVESNAIVLMDPTTGQVSSAEMKTKRYIRQPYKNYDRSSGNRSY